jgi:DNA-binding response OmpR family regulator
MLKQFPGQVTILLVDDDENVLALLTQLTSKMGVAEVLTAKNGGAGLIVACEKKPTLIVCDLMMHPVDGLSFLGGLRNAMDDVVASIPVMMFTAEGDAGSEAKSNRLGTAGFFKKPFNPTGLAERLCAVAEKRLKELADGRKG